MAMTNFLEAELASGFIGFIVSLCLYGTTLAQTILYFRSFPSDGRPTKSLVCFLCVADTFHVFLLSHMFWHFLIYGRSIGFLVLTWLPWELSISFTVAYIVMSVVQCFFALRVWRISSKNWIVTSIICVTGMTQLGAGMAFSAHLVIVKIPTSVFNTSGIISGQIQLVSSMACDIAISASLVYYFSTLRVGMEKTKHVLQYLVILSVNTGVILCLATAVTLILFQVESGTFISLGPHFVLSKLYINCLLATLNSRKHFRDIANRTVDFPLPTISNAFTMPVSHHDSSPTSRH